MRRLALALLVTATSFSCIADDTKKDNAEPTATKSATASKQDETPVKLTPDGEAHPPNVWMQQKLKHSQRIFAGMVEGDLFAVEDAARHLKFMSRLENFVKSRHKGYRTQLKAFQFANDEIIKGAKEKNIDRVTLGYNQMTLSCVACHKQLRNAIVKGKESQKLSR